VRTSERVSERGESDRESGSAAATAGHDALLAGGRAVVFTFRDTRSASTRTARVPRPPERRRASELGAARAPPSLPHPPLRGRPALPTGEDFPIVARARVVFVFVRQLFTTLDRVRLRRSRDTAPRRHHT